MRLVRFPYSGGVVSYPAEGASAFKNTTSVDGYVVGEYYGTDDTLEAYTGEWPVGKAEAAKALAREWRDEELLTTDEMVKIPDLPMMADLLAYRQTLRDWPSSVDFPDTKPTQPQAVASLVRRNR